MFDLELRKAELETIWQEQGWRGIAAIAKPLLIEKPSDGWKSAIPLIVDAEYKQATEKHNDLINSLTADESDTSAIVNELSKTLEELKTVVKEQTIPEKELDKEPLLNPRSKYKPKGIYATEYFKKLGIPYCDTCGAQHQHDSDGNPVCAENYSQCPRLTGESA